ncbi:MAG TPA: exodeoxyribonuclease VII large subunit [Pyrinomonadaceae bacterium]|nr:exodeoxyribonuclease VII large subunit [Pyrinomonadaceae bacterium]
MENFSLLNSLFDKEERRPWSVTELNARVKGEVERSFASVWVEGEITSFSVASSGHWYFNLNDGLSQVRAVCFRNSNFRVRFKPENGLHVRVRGSLTVYEKKGEYQLIAESIEPVGEGALRVAFEQIKALLEQEGLFDPERKRRLPLFPHRVGVVTSPGGAVIHDIINVLTRRTRTVSVILIPARVQGEYAGEEIAEAISMANNFNERTAEKNKFDVLIVARGGGAAEDLWAFNEERVARAIYGSKIPVISAVGHETDLTIADMVADLRAPTPSAAAELVAAHEAQLENYILERQRNLSKLISWKLAEGKNDLQRLSTSYAFMRFPQNVKALLGEIEDARNRLSVNLRNIVRQSDRTLDKARRRLSPVRMMAKVGENRGRLQNLADKSAAAAGKRIAGSAEKLKIGMAALDALSPLNVLGRGYAIAYGEKGNVLREAEAVSVDETVKVRLAKGKFEAKVTRINEDGG